VQKRKGEREREREREAVCVCVCLTVVSVVEKGKRKKEEKKKGSDSTLFLSCPFCLDQWMLVLTLRYVSAVWLKDGAYRMAGWKQRETKKREEECK
jgi:hypothetical protein